MAVQDLWHARGAAGCPECKRKNLGAPTRRHGRGLRWRVTVGEHPTRSFDVQADAKAWERHLLETVAGGDTVGDLLDLWLAGKRGLTQGGYDQCARAAERVRSAWGMLSPADLQRAELQAWVAGMQVAGKTRGAPLHPASHTVRSKAIQALGGALRIAMETGQIRSNPAEQLKAGKPAKRAARFLEPAELKALAEASVWPSMIWMLGTGGYRASESLALTVGDIDVRRGRVRVVKSKNGEGRDVPIMPSVLAMLDLDRPATAPLLIHPKGAKTDRRTLRNNVVVPAARRAGLGPVTTHDLRHTAASLAIASGADVKMVQTMLGHKSAAMTLDLYGHLWASGLDAVVDRMGAMFEGDSVPKPYRPASD